MTWFSRTEDTPSQLSELAPKHRFRDCRHPLRTIALVPWQDAEPAPDAVEPSRWTVANIREGIMDSFPYPKLVDVTCTSSTEFHRMSKRVNADCSLQRWLPRSFSDCDRAWRDRQSLADFQRQVSSP